MSTKQTALIMQLTSDDGAQKGQMVVFPGRAVYRRSLSPETNTRWRHVSVGDLTKWVPDYVTLTKTSPTPMEVTHGPVLIEVTEDEAAKAADNKLERNVKLRYDRVLKAMNDGVLPIMPSETVADYVAAWMNANSTDDNAWLDRNIHPNGSAKEPAPAPAPAAPPVVVAAMTGKWSYPPIVGGYATRPNGEKYKVRMVEGIEDVTMIRDSRPLREHVLLTGEPGTGKTALLDAAFGKDLVTMLGTEDTSVDDFIGGWSQTGINPDGSPKYVWIDGALVEAMERGVPLLIDEVGVITPKVMTITFSVMDGRDRLLITGNPARGEVVAQPGFIVVAATNPNAPGVRLSEALLSRFALTMEVGTDYEAMKEMGVPEELCVAGANLDTRRKNEGTGYAPQARELLNAARQYKTRGEMIALRNLISSAPEEVRPIVVEVLARTTGKPKAALTSLAL